MKGSSAAEEVAAHSGAIARLGGGPPRVHECLIEGMDPALVVEVVRERHPEPSSSTRQRSTSRSRRW
jgi:16S rRNA (guanine527-N7)-methyltransferase